jgi:uncharacterized protein YlaI
MVSFTNEWFHLQTNGFYCNFNLQLISILYLIAFKTNSIICESIGYIATIFAKTFHFARLRNRGAKTFHFARLRNRGAKTFHFARLRNRGAKTFQNARIRLRAQNAKIVAM